MKFRSRPLSARFLSRAAVLLCLLPGLSRAAGAEEILRFDIREYRVAGDSRLPRLAVEEAVYPYLGPARNADDVEAARAALEKAYHDRGFQTVAVSIPQQDPRRGVIRLEVVESTIGRLRVKGARFFAPSRIRREVPSLADGGLPDMNAATRELMALNRSADRRVTPELRPGSVPGTVDVDLKVEDKRPLHGSIELNNRYSANTTHTRLNGSLSYGNLFQLGHTVGASFQIAPENPDDARVFSGYYLARVSGGVSLMISGTKQDSDISTLGGAAVGGRGDIIGLRALVDLPQGAGFSQTLSLGMDRKNFEENLVIGPDTVSSPIEYYPLVADYGAAWLAEGAFTDVNLSLNFHLRGLGSGETDYTNKRYGADGSYVYLRADASHTRDLKGGSQLYGKAQAQLASQPLVNAEQIAGGGLGTVRGYLEATALGDNGMFGTAEWRTPSWIGVADADGRRNDEWRFHLFADAGLLGVREALPGQQRRYGLASIGAGTRWMVRSNYNGSVDVAVPLIGQSDTRAGEIRITFRGWAEF